jgi:hypothetical protein
MKENTKIALKSTAGAVGIALVTGAGFNAFKDPQELRPVGPVVVVDAQTGQEFNPIEHTPLHNAPTTETLPAAPVLHEVVVEPVHPPTDSTQPSA